MALFGGARSSIVCRNTLADGGEAFYGGGSLPEPPHTADLMVVNGGRNPKLTDPQFDKFEPI